MLYVIVVPRTPDIAPLLIMKANLPPRLRKNSVLTIRLEFLLAILILQSWNIATVFIESVQGKSAYCIFLPHSVILNTQANGRIDTKIAELALYPVHAVEEVGKMGEETTPIFLLREKEKKKLFLV